MIVEKHERLFHLPLPLFAIPMGVGGLGLAWREAGRVLGAPAAAGEGLLLLASLLWVFILVLHVLRALRHPQALADDMRHPVRSAFAGAITIGAMIVSGGLIPYAPDAARLLWCAAVLVHVGIGIWTVRGLMLAPREAAALTPPLLIPLVGNILAPVFGAKLGMESLSWMLFGVGALLWAMVQPLLMGRLITGPALPEKLRPTLAIFLAPPAVASIALARLTDGYGDLPVAVFGLAVFTALVLLTMARLFSRVPFALSWWAWTFPSAAFVVAALGVAHHDPALLPAPVLWVLLSAASLLLAIVGAATLRAAAAGDLIKPE